MKTLVSIVSAAILTVAASAASAAPVQLTTDQLDNVTAGARTSWAYADGFAAGLFPYSSTSTSSHASWWGTSSYASNTSSAFIGVVTSSASSGACSGFWC